jgi:hypothetical protein
MVFVKAGDKPSRSRSKHDPALLAQACDWRMMVDLPRMQYQFPAHIAVTEQRPDLVLWSDTLRVLVLLELTVPAEKNVMDAFARKTRRYEELSTQCTDGYRVELLPVEVGVLGFVADSTRRACRKLGVWSKELNDLLSEIALRCSYAIFVSRKLEAWKGWRVFQPGRQ